MSKYIIPKYRPYVLVGLIGITTAVTIKLVSKLVIKPEHVQQIPILYPINGIYPYNTQFNVDGMPGGVLLPGQQHPKLKYYNLYY